MDKEPDLVKNPTHYQLMEGIESIEIIACALTEQQWFGFCLGNTIKYRLRAGKKADALTQDIAKANNYANILYTKYLHLCRK